LNGGFFAAAPGVCGKLVKSTFEHILVNRGFRKRKAGASFFENGREREAELSRWCCCVRIIVASKGIR